MSINRVLVPDIDVLTDFLKRNGSNLFFKKYVNKIDTLIGEEDSVDFIENFESKYYKKSMSDEIFYKLD